ncbi:hypothetical protein D3C85_1065050 [compost metagenome]
MAAESKPVWLATACLASSGLVPPAIRSRYTGDSLSRVSWLRLITSSAVWA